MFQVDGEPGNPCLPEQPDSNPLEFGVSSVAGSIQQASHRRRPSGALVSSIRPFEISDADPVSLFGAIDQRDAPTGFELFLRSGRPQDRERPAHHGKVVPTRSVVRVNERARHVNAG